MTHPSDTNFLLVKIPTDSPAIKALSLWFGLLIFFFSPEVIHAEFLDRLELLSHLRQGHYQQLEQILIRQERLYQASKIPEEHLEAAYFAFANSAPDLEEKLNEWAQQPNRTGTAHLARGMYYWNIGWKTRGWEYAAETPNERFRDMKPYFASAWQDLLMATRLKSQSGIPYAYLISIAMTLDDQKGVNQYTQKGLAADPRSFVVRWKHLWSLTPWWSGLPTESSIKASQTFLEKEVIPHLKNNSTLKPLLGFLDFIRAETYDRNDEEEKATPHYESALKHGRYYYYTYSLGKNLFYLDKDDEALNVLTAALQDRPQAADIHDYRARVLEALKRPKQALAEQAKAIALDELDPGNLRRYAWKLNQQHRLEEAEIALTQALTFGSHDHTILGRLGRIYLEDFNDPDRALPYLKKAVQLKSENSWYWLNYGWALHKLENCQAIEILDRYQNQCWISGKCDSYNIDWAKKTSQRMIWKEGCWREHPTLKILSRFVQWLPKL